MWQDLVAQVRMGSLWTCGLVVQYSVSVPHHFQAFQNRKVQTHCKRFVGCFSENFGCYFVDCCNHFANCFLSTQIVDWIVVLMGVIWLPKFLPGQVMRETLPGHFQIFSHYIISYCTIFVKYYFAVFKHSGFRFYRCYFCFYDTPSKF